MKKKLSLALILAFTAIFITGCVDMNCFSDEDCPKNYVCYNSQHCAETDSGIECSPQEGDLRCHKLCSTRLECDYLDECKEFTIFKQDKAEKFDLCS